jgi:FkbM family methyltransferase
MLFSMKNFMMRLLGNISALAELPLPFSKTALSYIDIGARGGPPSNWLKLGQQMNYLCFEPDPAEAEALRLVFSRTPNFRGVVSQCALGATSGSATLYLTHSRPCSSLLKPNSDLLNMFVHRDLFRVEQELSLQTGTLDAELQRLGSIGDFIKIDVQGYELEVLKGGQQAVSNSIGCELEVSFIEIYKNQPLFADIDQWMRARGFFLADLERIWWRRAAAPPEIHQRGSLAYGNAIYLKSDIADPKSTSSACKGAIICVALGLHELAYQIVTQAERGRLFSLEEAQGFRLWLHRHQRSTIFWHYLANSLGALPGRQTLARWLGLWSNCLQGNRDADSDANSWNRKTSW